jgi:HK97 gp10 family phage protein
MAETIPGLAELDRALAELPKSIQKGVLRRVGLAALEPFVEKVRAMAPVDEDPTSSPQRAPGTLRDSYHAGTKLNKAQARTARREGKSSVEVYAGTNDRAGVLTEFGTGHSPAQPHARPAWDASQKKVLELVKSGLATEIEKARARLARRQSRG